MRGDYRKVRVGQRLVQHQHKITMVLVDKLLDRFCSHAAVVNDDTEALEKEVEIVGKRSGFWCRVMGFSDFKQLFLALHIAKAKNRKFQVAYVKENSPLEGQIILKRVAPDIKIVKYSDTQHLPLFLAAHR